MKLRLRSLVLLTGMVGASTCGLVIDAYAQMPADSAVAAPAPRLAGGKDQVERRLVSVATLIENSSSARQIEASGKPEAQTSRAKARELHQQAEDAYKAGKYSDATQLLDQAARAMMEGVRLAAPEQLAGEKKRRDFDNRMESVKALLSAQKRISSEKKLGPKGAEASGEIEAQMREASELAAAGKLDEGRALLDKVYVATRMSIENMRGGDTLVRSLQFNSKEEEYHYELDRNDTHKMLVKVLVDEKRASNSNIESMVQKYVDQAATLRTNAEGMAGKRDFESAVKTLEDSTKELVRAIRSAGVYIPM